MKRIKKYAEQGYKTLYFGRTDIANIGLRRYKSSWGATEYSLKYYRFDMTNEQFVSTEISHFYKLVNFLFRSMPISASKIVSNQLYRYFG